MTSCDTCSMDLEKLPLDCVEILNKITPNDEEVKKFQQFTKDKKNPKSLAENDRFLYEVCVCMCTCVCVHVCVSVCVCVCMCMQCACAYMSVCAGFIS